MTTLINVSLVLTETFELPGVVPYPDDGRLATDHRLPSAFLMLANANWFGDTFGESIGDTICAAAAATDGEWHLGRVGDVVAIMDLRWPRVEGRREDRLSSFCRAKEKRGR